MSDSKKQLQSCFSWCCFLHFGFKGNPSSCEKMKLKVNKANALVLRRSRSFEDECCRKMAAITAATMRQVVAFTLSLSVDLLLFYASGFAVFHSVFGHFTRLWLCAALRWLALIGVCLLTLGVPKALLIRFITAHSLLPAVFETGTNAFYREESECGQLGDVRCWLLFSGASLAAALFWEITIPDSEEEAEGKEQKQKSRVLFMRVVRLFRPDYPLLFGGLVFLSLAVICKYPVILQL